MGKIVLFLPNDEMIGCAMQILQNQEYFIDVIKQVDTENIVAEAKCAVRDGADVIIARGNQAMFIKQNLTVPVVDIRATGQELGLLLTAAKKISGKDQPEIAVIASKNMLPDTTHLGEIYGVDIKVYIAHTNMDIGLLVRKVAENKPDVIIGGSNVFKAAKECGIKTVYFSLTQDSLREAFRVAEMLKYARDIEKKSNAQIKALIDHSFTGILRTDKAGSVILVNELMKNLLQKREKEIVGKKILRLLPELEEWGIKRVLENGEPVLSTYMVIQDQAVNLIITPIVAEGNVEGMILFSYPVKKLQRSVSESGPDPDSLKGYQSFDDIFHQSLKMQQCLHLARSYVRSSSPVFISGEPGTEKRELAEIIYHCSEYKYGPFIAVDCAALDEVQQEKIIFGNWQEKDDSGAINRAEKGILLLQNIDYLTERNQARLFENINDNQVSSKKHGRSGRMMRLLTTGTQVEEMVEEGLFSYPLFCLIGGLTLEIPPLRERKEDLECALDFYFELYKKTYSRYFTLTKGARSYILGQSWYGNLISLDRFCEQMILTSDVRVIHEDFVRNMLEAMTWQLPVIKEDGRKESSEKDWIIELLEKYHGDRQRIADDIGISKVTLWRKMKKYQIE